MEDDSLVQLARDYIEREKGWQTLAERLRFNAGKITYPEAFEGDLIFPVEAAKPNSVFAAVDGGLGDREFHGVDLVIGRAVACAFGYENGKLSSHHYLPNKRPRPDVAARTGLDAHELTWFKSLFRLRQELSCAIAAIEKWKPAYLMLDGSVAPLVSDKPSEDSELNPMYLEVVELYRKLYSTAASSKCTLVGITKDSRGRRFVEMLSKNIGDEKNLIAHASDTAFLDVLLKGGERTFAFGYSRHPSTNPVLKDLGEWASKIVTFYLKPIDGDRPLRVEFLSTGTTFSEVASAIAGLSVSHPHYAYPAILIEADLCAALEANEVERVVRDLNARIGGKRPLMPLRRDSRPFR